MKHDLLLGVALTLLAAFLYSSQAALVKAEYLHLPPLPVVIFIQSIVALTLILPIIFKNGPAHAKNLLLTKKIGLHLLRTVFSLSISFLLFYSVTFIPLVNSILLANTAPLITPFLAYLFLSQKINHRLWVPILIGYAGVAIVLHPDSRIFNPASLLALGAAFAWASTMLTVRKLSATDATETIAFYFFLFSSILSGLISLFFWTPITTHMMIIMLIIGILYFLTQYAATSALKYAHAQLVGSLFYANILYATAISQFVWNILPALSTLAGMVLIIIGGLLCIHVEHTTHQHSTALKEDELDYANES
ncbi:hypothetical protein AQULUS_13660 [Aquicella lusitana]|uniref:EamA-like transporter family protein n=2 Tax=Aquicella lusitana TaxID=254246 RepID=A0A370GCS1_9COXI|nr:EamA-like transporter family protein [Aquicella lusitana]VVC73619.1 hypothetical protein AQULUS_13660 [Aquicella lusitana]